MTLETFLSQLGWKNRRRGRELVFPCGKADMSLSRNTVEGSIERVPQRALGSASALT